MSSSYLWVKAFHIVFVASWFAGLFYLPRIFVNLAMEADAPARPRLLEHPARPSRTEPSVGARPCLCRVARKRCNDALEILLINTP
jgi:hypothetical protein